MRKQILSRKYHRKDSLSSLVLGGSSTRANYINEDVPWKKAQTVAKEKNSRFTITRSNLVSQREPQRRKKPPGIGRFLTGLEEVAVFGAA